MKQNAKKCAIGEEVFILGGQRIDQKRKKGWWRGRRERIEKGSSREDIETERKETKGNLVNNLKRRIRNIDTCLFISSRHCVSSEFLTRFCSKALQQ